MSNRLTRRAFMGGLAAGSLLPWWPALGANDAAASQAAFPWGVASGDPDAHSVVLWTRVASPRLEARVTWTLADDPAFLSVRARGEMRTDVAHDHSAKVVVEGLDAGRTYYYRFAYDGSESIIGRTRTLPLGAVDRYGLAVVSCSNYPFGHFNAYDAIAMDDEVDLVLHLGDYLYEYGADEWGSETGAALGRVHAPAHEILSLSDYRTRHGQYKAEPNSILMHAAHPLIAIWDDHESANNPWTDGAQNHQADEGAWSERRRDSLQAYYEWMPIRPAADRARYWRHFRIGDLASIVSLETRHTGRAEQIDYLEHLSVDSTAEDIERFREDVLAAPGRTMLSSEQETFLAEALTEAKTTLRPWRILANQIPMARVHVPNLRGKEFEPVRSDPEHPEHRRLALMAALGDANLPIYLDTWDGYPWARERLYEQCRTAGVQDLLVLTGDSHAFWLNYLHDAAGAPMGVELGTTGVSSPGDFSAFGAELSPHMDRLFESHNSEVVWTDNGPRGWLRVRLTTQTATADFLGVDRVDGPQYNSFLVRRTILTRRDGTLEIDA